MRVKVDGVEYELPTSMKLGELQIVERYTEGHLESDSGYGLSKLMGQIHVAIKRARPDVSYDEIRARVEEMEADDIPEIRKKGDAADPPTEPSANEPSAQTSAGDSEPALEESPEMIPRDSGAPSSEQSAASVRRISGL